MASSLAVKYRITMKNAPIKDTRAGGENLKKFWPKALYGKTNANASAKIDSIDKAGPGRLAEKKMWFVLTEKIRTIWNNAFVMNHSVCIAGVSSRRKTKKNNKPNMKLIAARIAVKGSICCN